MGFRGATGVGGVPGGGFGISGRGGGGHFRGGKGGEGAGVPEGRGAVLGAAPGRGEETTCWTSCRHPGRVLESAAASWPFGTLSRSGLLSAPDGVGVSACGVGPAASRCSRATPF